MAKSLLEVLRDVSLDPSEQAAFSADPSGYLAQYGYEDVHPDDISEAFSLVADTLPPEQAQTVADSQAAGQFGAGVGAGDEGLATNGEAPTFGAGYEAPGPDVADGIDDVSGPEGFGDDLAFGEGSGGEQSGPDDLDDDGAGGVVGIQPDDGQPDDDGGFDDSFGDQDAAADTTTAGGGFGAPADAALHEADDAGYDESFDDGDSGFVDTDDAGFDDSFGDTDDIGSF